MLSFGTAGCNLGCKFCQNWTTTKSRDVEAACELAAPEAIAEAAHRLHCRSVAFTYNDPIVWAEYAIDTAKACHRRGIKTVAVTSGYINPGPREAFYEHIDAANVRPEGVYRGLLSDACAEGISNRCSTPCDGSHGSRTCGLEITNLLIPQANDSPDEIERMCHWILGELGPDVPLHFSAFHPDFKLTDRGPTPRETLVAAYDIARRVGLRYVYNGNVVDTEHQATCCPGCGTVVIGRDGYLLREYSIQAGSCATCGTKIAGRFDDAPGTWGGRRAPIRIADYSSRTAVRTEFRPAQFKDDRGPAAAKTLRRLVAATLQLLRSCPGLFSSRC